LSVKLDIFEEMWPGFNLDLDTSKDIAPKPLPYLESFFNKHIRGQVNHARPTYVTLSKF
jgi:hypothetical protein